MVNNTTINGSLSVSQQRMEKFKELYADILLDVGWTACCEGSGTIINDSIALTRRDIKRILDKGPTSDGVGVTPLMYMAMIKELNEVEILDELLSTPFAGIDLKDEKGLSALDYAVNFESNYQINELLKAGATVSDATLKLARDKASTSSNATEICELIKGYFQRTEAFFNQFKSGGTPNENDLERIIQSGISFNKTDLAGNTPLILASSEGLTEVVQQLLQLPNINVNHQSLGIETALLSVTRTMKDSDRLARLLIKHPNIDVNLKDRFGNTPLILAAYHGKVKVVKLLLSCKNIDVDHKANDGRTALVCAQTRFKRTASHDAVVRLLQGHIQSRSSQPTT